MSTITLDLTPHYGPNYNPTTQRVQWMDQIRNQVYKQPGYAWHMPKGQNTIAELAAKGVTQVTRGELGSSDAEAIANRNAGYGYDDVVKTPTMFFLGDTGVSAWTAPPGQPLAWPNIWNNRYWQQPPGATEPMSYEEGKRRGERYPAEYTLYVFENGENEHAISPHWACCKGWVEGWAHRVDERWPDRLVLKVWNYIYSYGQPVTVGTREQKKALLDMPINQLPYDQLLPGGTLAPMNAFSYPIYIGHPDAVRHVGYDIIYKAEQGLRIGKYMVVFPQAMHEGWPNIKTLWELPTGDFYFQSKMKYSPGLGFTSKLFSSLFAKAFVPFGFTAKDDRPLRLDKQWHSDCIFVKDGDPETQTSNVDESGVWGPQNQYEVFPANGFEDDAGFASDYYDRLFAENHIGGTREFCEFRVDGGPWIPALNDSVKDAVDAWEDKRGLAIAWYKPGKVSFLLWNGCAPDTQRHTWEVKFKGNIYVANHVAGTMPYGYKSTW